MKNKKSAKKKKSSPSAGQLLFRISIVLFAIIFAGICVWVFIDSHIGSSQESVSIYLFNGTKNLRQLEKSECFSKNGEVLISMDILTDYCGYAISGDNSARTLVFPDGSFAAFSDGVDSAKTDTGVLFMSEAATMRDGSMFVPLSFYEEHIKGLLIERYEEKNRIEIDIAAPDYSLMAGYDIQDEKIAEDDVFGKIVEVSKKPTFVSNLSAYEQYMDPVDRDKYLYLVNTDNRLQKDSVPESLYDLIHTRKDGRTTQQMELYAGKAMEAMLTEAYANGYTSLSVTSAYRSYNYQQLLFDNQISALRPYYGDSAEAKAAEAVAIPGSSEHQSGLCADLHNLPAASQVFAEKPEYQWLLEHCADFGFILRYPKNKTDITGIMFEPWHYRFVGRYHAQKIMESGLCLEEYCEKYYSGNI